MTQEPPDLYATPLSDAYFAGLDAATAERFAEIDAALLEDEKRRVAPHIAAKLTAPTRGVRKALAEWEQLARWLNLAPDRMYFAEEYINDLYIRDSLEGLLNALPPQPRTRLAAALGAIDDQFKNATVDDGGASFAHYTDASELLVNLGVLNETPAERTVHGWWWRRSPKIVPWRDL